VGAGGIGAAEEPEAISKQLGVPALIEGDVHQRWCNNEYNNSVTRSFTSLQRVR
jgi:hypothetical protein